MHLGQQVAAQDVQQLAAHLWAVPGSEARDVLPSGGSPSRLVFRSENRYDMTMATRSHDAHPRGTIVRDRDGDQWRKGTAWWHWTGRRADTGPGKLLWRDLEERYGPLAVTATVCPVAPRPRGSIPRDHEARLAAAKEERDRADAQLKTAVADASEAGASVRELANFLDVSTNTIQRWKREVDQRR